MVSCNGWCFALAFVFKKVYVFHYCDFWAFLLQGSQVGRVMVAYLQTVIQKDSVISNLQILLIYIYKWVRTFCVVREKVIK